MALFKFGKKKDGEIDYQALADRIAKNNENPEELWKIKNEPEYEGLFTGDQPDSAWNGIKSKKMTGTDLWQLVHDSGDPGAVVATNNAPEIKTSAVAAPTPKTEPVASAEPDLTQPHVVDYSDMVKADKDPYATLEGYFEYTGGDYDNPTYDEIKELYKSPWYHKENKKTYNLVNGWLSAHPEEKAQMDKEIAEEKANSEIAPQTNSAKELAKTVVPSFTGTTKQEQFERTMADQKANLTSSDAYSNYLNEKYNNANPNPGAANHADAVNQAQQNADAAAYNGRKNNDNTSIRQDIRYGVDGRDGSAEKKLLFTGYGKDALTSGFGIFDKSSSNAAIKAMKENRAVGKEIVKDSKKANKALENSRSALTDYYTNLQNEAIKAYAEFQKSLSEETVGPGSGARDQELKANIDKYNNVLKEISIGGLDAINQYAQQSGDEKLMRNVEALNQAWSGWDRITKSGQPLTAEEIKEVNNQIQEIDKMIKQESKSDVELNVARDEHKAKVNDFLYFLLDSLATGFVGYVALANGDTGTALGAVQNSALAKRNGALAQAETKFRTDALDAMSQANTMDILSEPTANFARMQILPELEKTEAFMNLKPEEKAREVQGVKKAYDEYMSMTNQAGTPEDFQRWYTLQYADGSSVGAAIISALKMSALNPTAFTEVLKSLGEMFNTGLTSSDENLKTGIIKVGGRAGGWIDNAMSKAATPVEVPQTDPSIAKDKQSIVNSVLQSKMQTQEVPQGQPITPNQGWGATN